MSFLTNLISYWKLDEASGTRNDSFGSNHLTDNNSLLSTTGKIGNSGNFVLLSTQYLSHASNSDLQMGDIDFTFSAWIYLNSTPLNAAVIVKDSGSPLAFDYLIRVDNGTLNFILSSDGTVGTLTVLEGGPLSTGQWYFICAWYDSTLDTMYVQINNATPTSKPQTGGGFAGAPLFTIGAGYSGTSEFFNGRIDEVGVWKRTLTDSERLALYNSGNGLAFPFLVTPTGFGAESSSSLTLLFWNGTSTEPDFFRLQRSENNVDWTTIATPAAHDTSYNDFDTVDGTFYYYRLRAENSYGVGDWVTTTVTAEGPVIVNSLLYLIRSPRAG